TTAQSKLHKVGTTTKTEFFHNPCTIRFNRFDTNPQLFSNVLIGKPLCDQTENLTLSRTEFSQQSRGPVGKPFLEGTGEILPHPFPYRPIHKGLSLGNGTDGCQ